MFKEATRLFYSNEEVAKSNYEKLIQLNQPIAQIQARHSSNKSKSVTSQDMSGLQPTFCIAKNARVMLTANLWPVSLCNGATGTAVDIVYTNDCEPPILPVLRIVRFENCIRPSISDIPFCVPIPPDTVSVNINNVMHEQQQ